MGEIVVTMTVEVATARIDQLLARLHGIEAIVADYAEQIRALTESLAPVDTGADKASVRVALFGLAAEIAIGGGLPRPYGKYQELGFYHAGSGAFIQNPALIPAFETLAPAFRAAVAAQMRL